MRRFLFLILAVSLAACFPETDKKEKSQIVFEKETIQIISPDKSHPAINMTVEIADTNAKRMRGLMYRTELADDAGMLFLFPVRQRISMWMANTQISLDMLFIDEQGKVREIVENAVPFSHEEIRSKNSVSSVLEIKGGQSERLNIQVGDMVVHPFFKLEKDK